MSKITKTEKTLRKGINKWKNFLNEGAFKPQVQEARMGEYGKIDAEDGNPPSKIGRGNEEYMAAYNAVLQARGEEPLDIQKPDAAYLDALRSGQLEENITDVNDGYLELINDIRIRNFDWIDRPNSMKKVGVIAQELEKVIPNVVSKGGDDPNKQPYQVAYPTLVPYLIKAVQELSTKVTELESKLGE